MSVTRLGQICAAALLMLAGSGVWADYAKGREALARKDYLQAGLEFEAAAKGGNVQAMAALGLLYNEGLGVERDARQAFEWFEKAAEAGHVPSQGQLAGMYSTGQGTPKHDAKSLFWARRAAEGGDPVSQYIMGVRHAEGMGVRRNAGQALLWFGAAAEQGHPQAQYSMGFLMTQGAALNKSDVEARELRQQAYKWLLIARRNGVADAQQGLAKLAPLLSADQISKAESDATAWKPIGAGKSAASTLGTQAKQ